MKRFLLTSAALLLTTIVLSLLMPSSRRLSAQNVTIPQSFANVRCADSSGSGTAQSCSTTPSFTAGANTAVLYTTTTPNAGDLTIAVNGGSAQHVHKWLGQLLASGDLPANVPVWITNDGTFWNLTTIGNAARTNVNDLQQYINEFNFIQTTGFTLTPSGTAFGPAPGLFNAEFANAACASVAALPATATQRPMVEITCNNATDWAVHEVANPYGNITTKVFDVRWEFRLVQTATSSFGAGLFDNQNGANAQNLLYVRFIAGTDTNFRFVCTASGTENNNVDSTVAPTAGNVYTARVYSTTAGTIGMQLFSNGVSVANNASVCTGANVPTANIGPGFRFASSAATMKIDMGRFSETSTQWTY